MNRAGENCTRSLRCIRPTLFYFSFRSEEPETGVEPASFLLTGQVLYRLSYSGTSWLLKSHQRPPVYETGALLPELNQREWSGRELNPQRACVQSKCHPRLGDRPIDSDGVAPSSRVYKTCTLLLSYESINAR